MPRIRLSTAVKIRRMYTLPPDMASITPTRALFSPVELTAPTMMPAAATAMAMAIMLRAPAIRPP